MNKYLKPIALGIIILSVIVMVLVTLMFFHKNEIRKIYLINSEGKSIEIDAEMADNWFSLANGLMGRKSLPENSGMLFVFDRTNYHSFWMLNTTIPLDAIFIDETGSVVDIIKMNPCKSLTCPSYSPKLPAKYVLEVNQGFCEKKKITAGNSSMKLQ